jgi:ATP-dependent RNA helicase RhlE
LPDIGEQQDLSHLYEVSPQRFLSYPSLLSGSELYGPTAWMTSTTAKANHNSYLSKQNQNSSTGFDRFELHHSLIRGIKAAGFENPRPIQDETIPAGLEGRDVLGLAQTGTGKTAAFALPLLDRLIRQRRGGPRALILAPTRELATQIAAEIRTLAKYSRVKMAIIYGGVPQHKQVGHLRRRPEIIVGCPGRVLDLLQQGVLRLSQVETLVLDEADHMFDMGFLPDIRRILNALPERRQNLLFSATMPREIRRLANEILYKPHVAELADSAPADTVDHALYLVAEARKRDLLKRVLKDDDCDSAIVFTRTKHRAKRLAQQLSKDGHRAVGLQGNMSQNQRDRAMRGFRDRRFDILVATDIAARGIDVRGVSHVINFDVPNTPEAYTHRIGRTGRSELEGAAFTFVTGSDRGWLRSTERMIGEPIPRKQLEGFDHEAEAAGDANSPPKRNGQRSHYRGNRRRNNRRRYTKR